MHLTGERVSQTAHPKILIAQISPYPEAAVRSALSRLGAYASKELEDEIRLLLSELLVESRLTLPPTQETGTESLVVVGTE